MIYRQLGRTGLRVSAYGLGTNAFGVRADEATSIAVIHHAIDNGVTLIDTANVYTGTKSETIIGKALKDRRDKVVLATKVGWTISDAPNDGGSSRAHIFREVEGSLRRLQTDWIDLYQIHKWDGTTPLEETLRALDDLVRMGKVRYVGCSNYTGWQLLKSLWISDRHNLVRFDSVQPPYSPANRAIETELLPACIDQGVGTLVYFPLAGGILTGKYAGGKIPEGSRASTQPMFTRMLNDRGLALANEMEALASEAGVPIAQLSLAWVMAQPGVTVALVGATKVDQQAHNLKSVEVKLTPELNEKISKLTTEFIAAPAI
ncbi:MAG: aldo/keto reductase [Armatimonadetes bacterium]|nr:aldo/keto reductase [Armatimonadota bacterium]